MLRVVRKESELRCAYCHGRVQDVPPCPTCRTLVHRGCRLEAERCPTLGCADRSVVRRRRPFSWWIVLGLGLLVFVAGTMVRLYVDNLEKRCCL